MTVEYKFQLGQKVLVHEIGRPGVVHAMRVSTFGKEALVAYWNDGRRDEAWLYEWELEVRP